MAYVEIWKSGRLIKRRHVDEQKAQTGCRIRVGSLGQVYLTVGQSERLGEFEVRMCQGEPPPISEALKETASMPVPGQTPSPPSGESETGPKIEGYIVIGLLGEGGMGIVWRAEQLSTRRQVALKLMTAHKALSHRDQARFQREVELTARLDHPNIAHIYESGLHRGMYYYAMEFVEGVRLDQYVKSQGLSQNQILILMRTICQAVLYAHLRAVIHRDLKPSNILVTPDGQPHILDFGLAKALLEEDEAVTVSIEGQITGTPAYMSPEQAAGRHTDIDTRTDVFSLGVILYELLVGQSPHDLSGAVFDVLSQIAEGKIRRPRELNKSIDSELEAILLKALALNPEGRYASAGTLAMDIDNYLNDEPLDAPVPTTLYFVRKKAWKHRVQIGVAAAIVAILLSFYTIAIGHRARLRATEKELQIQTRKTKLAEENVKWSDLELKILGKNEEEARAALRVLRDDYLTAQQRISLLEQDIYRLNEKLSKVLPSAFGFTFSEPTNLGPEINSSSSERFPQIMPDGLELYFTSDRPGGSGGVDVWVSRRASINGTWGRPTHLKAPVNTRYNDWFTSISPDGLELYLMDFDALRPGGHGDSDIWVAKRTAADKPWGKVENLGSPINMVGMEADACISADGLTLYFACGHPGGYGFVDIWAASRATRNAPWGAPVNVGPGVNSPDYEGQPHILANNRVLLFVSGRLGPWDIYVSKRRAISEPWSEEVNLGPIINRPANDGSPSVSPDGQVLLFGSSRRGGHGDMDLWQSTIIPIVDLNRDGKVDVKDLTMLIEHWGELNMIIDIAPPPLGDGVVDRADLELFMRRWSDEPQQPTLPYSDVIDFNNDGVIDVEDLLILIEYWGSDDVFVDVAPLPSGDGTVDEKDLEVLMQHWGQHAPPPANR